MSRIVYLYDSPMPWPENGGEILKCVVVYKGDVTQPIRESYSRAPCRLLEDGNTEQIVDVFRPEHARVALSESVSVIEPFLLAECAKVGTVLSHRWLLVEASNGR